MKPIIGEISYKDMTAEDIKRFQHEAEVMRAEAIRDMFVHVTRSAAHAMGRAAHGFRAIFSNPGIHPNAGSH